ncbi:MAG: MBL fold metallo-hydrolase [Lachnospiraceae bacterium]|nr:MBL fold metallo-hydrolase [Lachnospiraceae bacterium]
MTENITVNEQNSIQIKDSQGMIYIDPFRIQNHPKDAAYIFITHDHYDHFSPEDIEKVACEKTIMIVPEKMEKKAQKEAGMISRIVTVKPGMQTEIGGIKFETVAAYNRLKPFHPKSAGWVGYIFLTDGKGVYVAGDTDATEEAAAVKCDIALVPVGGTYTMDAKKAAELVNKINPEVAIPVHYGSVVGSPKDGAEFAENVKAPVRVEIKIR